MYPSLDDARSATPTGTRKICLVTIEFPGPVMSGGIGSTMLGLARLLAKAGHEVTVLLVADVILHHDAAYWQDRYARQAIRFVHCACRPHMPNGPLSDRPLASHNAYRWLAGQAFDVVYFHENLGTAYYALSAMRAGLAFRQTLMCVGVHAPTRHALQANGATANDPQLVEIEAMEKACVRWADVVVSPSRHMLRWLAERGWPLHERCFVQANPLHLQPRKGHGRACPVNELVFFGRLERGKGVDIMCDALDSLNHEPPADLRVTFIGKNTWFAGQPTSEYIGERAAPWRFPCTVLEGLDSATALSYLARPGRLAVMPSRLENFPCAVQECLQLAIPFIASRVGGVPELVHAGDRDRVLFEPRVDSLRSALARILDGGAAPARPAVDLEENESAWCRWFGGVALPNREGTGGLVSPSFCIAVTGEDPDSHAFDPRPLEAPATPGHAAANARRRESIRRGGCVDLAGMIADTDADYAILADHRCRVDDALISRLEGVIRFAGADVMAFIEASLEGAPGTDWKFPVHGAGALGLARPFFGARLIVFRVDALRRAGGIDADSAPDPWVVSCQAYLAGLDMLAIPDAVLCGGVEAAAPADEAERYWRRLDLYRCHLPHSLGELACFAPWSPSWEVGRG